METGSWYTAAGNKGFPVVGLSVVPCRPFRALPAVVYLFASTFSQVREMCLKRNQEGDNVMAAAVRSNSTDFFTFVFGALRDLLNEEQVHINTASPTASPNCLTRQACCSFSCCVLVSSPILLAPWRHYRLRCFHTSPRRRAHPQSNGPSAIIRLLVGGEPTLRQMLGDFGTMNEVCDAKIHEMTICRSE